MQIPGHFSAQINTLMIQRGHRPAADAEVARGYESSKRKLMAKFAAEPRAYDESKTEFIQMRY